MAADADTNLDPIQKLVQSFCTLLDEALIVAIANDHDLHRDDEYRAAQETLQDLSAHVKTEEATGFNPSGITLDACVVAESSETDLPSVVATDPTRIPSQSHLPDSSGTETSSMSASESSAFRTFASVDGETEEVKNMQLRALFPDLKAYDVQYSLKKSNGDFQVALDDLLNIQYLESTGQQPKGVDGFDQTDGNLSTRKRKKKGRKSPQNDGSSTSSSALPLGSSGKESKHQENIAYLAGRFDFPIAEVSKVYYENRCSSGAAAVEILNGCISQGIEAQDEAGKQQVQELIQKYPRVPPKYISTVFQVAGTIPQFADDLVALLSKHFAQNPLLQKLDLSYTLKPLPEDHTDHIPSTTNKRPTVTSRSSSLSRPTDYASTIAMANHHNSNRREAMASAAQMSRRGGSNPLYKQAAGYYAHRAREYGQRSLQATSQAADILVNQNSTPNSIDLHGVQVQDGVRIARFRVQSWWDALGEFRSRKAKEEPFTVVTGVGRHSAGGVSRMRQGVARALFLDGWQMQVETGRFIVNGRR